MPGKSLTIGAGEPAVKLEEVHVQFPGLEVLHRRDDIRKPTDWRIQDDRHSIVVHLGGEMRRLETELEGFGGSKGAALPGEIWTVPAGRRYASHACGGSIEYAVLLLRPDSADILGGGSAGHLDLQAVAGVRDDFLFYAIRELTNVLRCDDDISVMLAESFSRSISLHLVRSLTLGSGLRTLRKGNVPLLNKHSARKLRDYVHDRLDGKISLAELAELAELTTHQFLVAFRQAFGCSPGQYVIRQRIRHAQRLLLDTRKDITTIALDSGFSSHSHLTATFTKYLRCSPSVFRSKARL